MKELVIKALDRRHRNGLRGDRCQAFLTKGLVSRKDCSVSFVTVVVVSFVSVSPTKESVAVLLRLDTLSLEWDKKFSAQKTLFGVEDGRRKAQDSIPLTRKRSQQSKDDLSTDF